MEFLLLLVIITCPCWVVLLIFFCALVLQVRDSMKEGIRKRAIDHDKKRFAKEHKFVENIDRIIKEE